MDNCKTVKSKRDNSSKTLREHSKTMVVIVRIAITLMTIMIVLTVMMVMIVILLKLLITVAHFIRLAACPKGESREGVGKRGPASTLCMRYSLNYRGGIIGAIKGDSRSLL